MNQCFKVDQRQSPFPLFHVFATSSMASERGGGGARRMIIIMEKFHFIFNYYITNPTILAECTDKPRNSK